MDGLNGGERVKQYRKMLNISQKEAAGKNLSHSMISLIESGKIQLTTVTAMILSDNFNKIAAEKGIELNLSLKDFLISKGSFAEQKCLQYLNKLNQTGIDQTEYDEIFVLAARNNLYKLQGLLKEKRAESHMLNKRYERAVEDLKDSIGYFEVVNERTDSLRVRIKAAECYTAMNNIDKAMEMYEDTRKNISIYGNVECEEYSLITGRLINLYYGKGMDDKCLEYIHQCTAKDSFDTNNREEFLLLEADIYLRSGRITDALYIYKCLMEYCLKQKARVYHNMSLALYLINHIEEGKNFLVQSLKAVEDRNEVERIGILLNMGDKFIEKGFAGEAIVYYECALNLSKNINDLEKYIASNNKLLNASKTAGNLDYFAKYAVDIESTVCSSSEDKHKLGMVFILMKFYVKAGLVHKLNELMALEDRILAK